MRLIFMALFTLFVAMPASAKVLNLAPNRLVEIIGVIDADIVKEAQNIDNMSRQSKAPIYLLINSPGGSITFGYTLIDSIHAAQARGNKVICASGVLAASMAFDTLIECDEIYTLKYTKLLFHPAKSRGTFGQLEAEMSAVELKEMDNRTIAKTCEVTGMSQAKVRKHYFRETLWEAYVLDNESPNDWMTIVDAINGSDKVFTYEKPMMLLLFGETEPNGNKVDDPLAKSHK